MKLELKKDLLKVLTDAEIALVAGGATQGEAGCTGTECGPTGIAECGGDDTPMQTSWVPCTNGCGSQDPVYCPGYSASYCGS